MINQSLEGCVSNSQIKLYVENLFNTRNSKGQWLNVNRLSFSSSHLYLRKSCLENNVSSLVGVPKELNKYFCQFVHSFSYVKHGLLANAVMFRILVRLLVDANKKTNINTKRQVDKQKNCTISAAICQKWP